jgi:divalent metal cation (Fe/Co/Zn/Cd) transporter
MTVDSRVSLIEAHNLSHQVEHELIHGVRRLSAATIRAEPLASDADPAHALVGHHD